MNFNSSICIQFINSIEFYNKTRRINIIFSLIIIWVGLIGNSLAVFVFGQRKFRKHSSSIYFLILCLIDAAFLLVHFFEDTLRTYIDEYINHKVYTFDDECTLNIKASVETNTIINNLLRLLNITDRHSFSCKFVNFLRYLLRFISAYIITAFTIQRTLAIYFPFFHSQLRSKKIVWLIVLCIIILSFIINLWVPFLFELTNATSNVTYCDIRKEFSSEYFLLTIFYISLIIFLPIITLCFCNTLIIFHVLNAAKKRKQMTNLILISKISSTNSPIENRESNINTEISFGPLSKNSLTTCDLNGNYLKNLKSQIKSNQVKRVLLLMSFSYVALNIPYFVSWCLFFYQIGIKHKKDFISKYNLFSILNIGEILYVSNYGVHFFVYCVSGREFRHQLKLAFGVGNK